MSGLIDDAQVEACIDKCPHDLQIKLQRDDPKATATRLQRARLPASQGSPLLSPESAHAATREPLPAQLGVLMSVLQSRSTTAPSQ